MNTSAATSWRSGWCSAGRLEISSTGCASAMSSTSPTCISVTSDPFWSLMSPTRRLASASSFCCFALSWPGQRRPRRLSIMRKALPLILLPALALGGCSIFRPQNQVARRVRRRPQRAAGHPARLFADPAGRRHRQRHRRKRPEPGDRGLVRRPVAAQQHRDQPARKRRPRPRRVGRALGRRRSGHARRRQGPDDGRHHQCAGRRHTNRVRPVPAVRTPGETKDTMTAETLSARLAELEFDPRPRPQALRGRHAESSRMRTAAFGEIQQALLGSPAHACRPRTARKPPRACSPP